MRKRAHTTRVAVYGILQKGDKILLLRRQGTGWMDGKYGLPAGHLEEGEKLAEAVIREIEEETGISVSKDDLEFIHASHRNEEGNYEYVDFYYAVQKWQGKPFIAEPHKADDLKWVSPNNLPANTVPNVRKAITAWQQGESISEIE